MLRRILQNRTARLVLAGFVLVLALGMFQAEEAEAWGGPCWMCVSYDLCGQSGFGYEDCTVTSGGHGCLPQCTPLGGPCFSN
ncbi:MAG: hypothetical protein SX243_01855 [Acidobacteriota bacterium]|nr:hypothetical protein [Acidobacteriota bacterium]